LSNTNYKLLFPPNESRGELLILDSHVLIDIEAYEKFKHVPNESFKHFLRDWKTGLKDCNLCLSPAIVEACYDRKKRTMRPGRFERMERAIHSFTGRASDAESTPESAANWVLKMLLPGYAALLKLRLLVHDVKTVKPLVLWEEYLRWMSEDLGWLLPYEMQIAQDYLVKGPGSTTRDYVQGLFKLKKKNPLQTTWSAAWDVFYLRLFEEINAGGSVFGSAQKTLLATFDGDLIKLSSRLIVRSENRGNVECHAFVLVPNIEISDAKYNEFDAITRRYADPTQRIERMQAFYTAPLEEQLATRDRELKNLERLVADLEDQVSKRI
jgi:hypothetical protein